MKRYRYLLLLWALVACGCEKNKGVADLGGPGLGSLIAPGAKPAVMKVEITDQDWPSWRGPKQTGIALAGQTPPLKWSQDENIVWKSPIPGRGHGSPIVVGDAVYLATAEEDAGRQWLLCYDRATGQEQWRKEVHNGGLDKKGNKKSSQASATPACDGERLFINFLNSDAIYTTALDLAGQQLWQTKVSGFKTHQGFGSSPMIYKDLVHVTTDSPGGGVIAALDRKSGDIVWKNERPAKANYASPIVHHLNGRDQLCMQGCDLVNAFDPLTGDKLWEMELVSTEAVTTLVTDGERVFASGGYPRNHVQAISADGSGKTEWENGARVYVPSMIVHEGHLYAMQDGGIAMCWKCDTGEEMWKQRVGGEHSASLVLCGDLLFATSEEAKTVVYRASPEKFEQVASNKLGDEAFATPVICGNRIYTRVVDNSAGKRQEWLYCIGEK